MRVTKLFIITIFLALFIFSSCELMVKKPAKPKIAAIFIGLDYWENYTFNGYLAKQLNGTIRDVKEVNEALEELAGKLKQNYSSTFMLQERKIVNEETLYPNKDNILSKVSEKIESLGDNDLLIVYYAGHGDTNTGSLVVATTQNVKTADLLKSTELLEVFNDMNKGNAILILDSCYSGNFIQPYFDSKNYNPRLLTISASTAYQDSYEKDIFYPQQHIHGVFTTYFLEALGWDHGNPANEEIKVDGLSVVGSLKPLNKIPVLRNGTITAGDIYSYIRKRVKGQRSLIVQGPLDKIIFSTKW